MFAPGGTFSIAISGLADGSHDLSVTAKDAVGNEGTPATISVIVDTIPPTVISTNPADGATGVSVYSPSISATFGESSAGFLGIDSSTITSSTFTLKDSNNNPILGTVALSSNQVTATFTPSQPLAYSTAHTATITTGVKDLAGNPISSEWSWTFTTKAPTIIYLTGWMCAGTDGNHIVNCSVQDTGITDINCYVANPTLSGGDNVGECTTNTGQHLQCVIPSRPGTYGCIVEE